jgi:5-methyltetrahydrofolate--homocysteine methyltransferase
MSRFLDALRSDRVLLMDGAMGTELQRAGLQPGECGELWNLTHPEKVLAIHQAYVDVGAEVLLTNTFQANPAALQRHNLADQMGVIWQAAVDLARKAAGPDRWVLADIGPFTFPNDHKEEWPRFVTAVATTGVDGILWETCSDLTTPFYMHQTLFGSGSHACPVLFSLTYLSDRTYPVQTICGEFPSKIANQADRDAVAALGVNCGRNIALPQLLDVIESYHLLTFPRVFVRPNAGTPKQVEDRWVYPHSPKYMASWLPELLTAGVSMIGGCCGTTPAHIAAFKPTVDAWNAGKRPK